MRKEPYVKYGERPSTCPAVGGPFHNKTHVLQKTLIQNKYDMYVNTSGCGPKYIWLHDSLRNNPPALDLALLSLDDQTPILPSLNQNHT